jgi:hypothetical protein
MSELRELFNEAFRDRERAELVALTSNEALEVERGEVLRGPRYYRVFSLE